MNIFRNNSRVFSGKIGRKLLMALGSPYKNRWSLLCDATTDEEVLWAPCTRIVWCCFKINAKRRLKIVIARVFLEFHGEYWEFSLLALQLNVEDINLVHSLFGPRQQDITPVFRLGDTALN